jgi:hypothetical protein
MSHKSGGKVNCAAAQTAAASDEGVQKMQPMAVAACRRFIHMPHKLRSCCRKH